MDEIQRASGDEDDERVLDLGEMLEMLRELRVTTRTTR